MIFQRNLQLVLLFLLFYIPCTVAAGRNSRPLSSPADTLLYLEEIHITAIKQGRNLKAEPLSSSVVNQLQLEKRNIASLSELAPLAPNFYMPEYGSRTTSSIYVRGLGARIDHPVLGLTIDNVPILNKDNYDFEMVDLERVEVIRGPQSALYGRNTMGGVINVYTLSPLSYQGVRAGLEYGSSNRIKARASLYNKALNEQLGYAVSAYYTQNDGFFTNQHTNELLDWEKLGGGRIRLQWQGDKGLTLDNTFATSILTQGGYPYQSLASGTIAYNDSCSFDRINLSNGFTLNKQWEKMVLSSVTSYQYSNNHLQLDNDFTPKDYFTLSQKVKEHTLTQDVVLKSHTASPYEWLIGAFAFAESTQMDAPVLFKKEGIDDMILANANQYDPQYSYEWLDPTLLLASDFEIPTFGVSLYHKSQYSYERWNFAAELRADFEHTQLHYRNYTQTRYCATNRDDASLQYPITVTIDNNETLKQNFLELLPKVSARYSLRNRGSLYASIAKGYKSGGFNTQMFSDVLQQELMYEMGGGKKYDVEDIVTYQPEYSWNYEVGSNLVWSEWGLSASISLFYLNCYDQQLTIFPEGSTGRLMTNAGKTQSYGGEMSLCYQPTEGLVFSADYGYTHATFLDYDNGREQYAGNFVPYAPQHTASLRGDYSWSFSNGSMLRAITLSAGAQDVGKVFWNEANSYSQPFYTLLSSSIGFDFDSVTVQLWGKNLANSSYNTFYFESIGNQFVQQGRPRSMGISLLFDLAKN